MFFNIYEYQNTVLHFIAQHHADITKLSQKMFRAAKEKTSQKPKRITSAPPGVQGYTYYVQAAPRQNKMNDEHDMNTKLEAWAKDASNYGTK